MSFTNLGRTNERYSSGKSNATAENSSSDGDQAEQKRRTNLLYGAIPGQPHQPQEANLATATACFEPVVVRGSVLPWVVTTFGRAVAR